MYFDLQRFAVTHNYTNEIIVTGSDGADSLYNYADLDGGWNGYNVTINAGGGDDYIYTQGKDVAQTVVIDPGDGNDTVRTVSNSTQDVTIKYASGDDNDLIQCNANCAYHLVITDGSSYSTLTDGSDLVVSIGSGSVRFTNLSAGKLDIAGGSQPVMISNSTNNTLVSGSSGADSIYNSGATVTIDAGAGNDTVYNYRGFNSMIIVGAGDDSVFNFNGNRSTIDCGAGNDTVRGDTCFSISVNGGEGNDYIGGIQYYSTIVGGKGDDTIDYGTERVIRYASGDGNDVVYNFDITDTLNITDGFILSDSVSGNDVILKIGDGQITLTNARSVPLQIKNANGQMNVPNVNVFNYNPALVLSGTSEIDSMFNAADNAVLTLGAGNDYIFNYKNNYTSIDAGTGDDSVYNYRGYYATINTGDGNDTVYNYTNSSCSASINTGNGNDSVYNAYNYGTTIRTGNGDDTVSNVGGSEVLIDAGEGHDYIYTSGSRATIRGGKGNDTVRFYKNVNGVVEYGRSDGNDIVYGFESGGTIAIVDGSEYSTAISGSDMLLYVGSTFVTFSGAADASINVIGGSINNSQSGALLDGTSGDDFITNTATYVTIDAGEGNDSINDNGYLSSVNGGSGNDSILHSNHYATIRGGRGDDLITLFGSQNIIQYANYDGDDTVFAFNITDTLDIASGSLTGHYKSGSNYFVDIGNGSIMFRNIGDTPIQIRDASGQLSAVNFAGAYNGTPNVILNGTSDSESLLNAADTVTVYAGDGNDSIHNYGHYVMINAGIGNDSIYNSENGDLTTIFGGAGNDYIYTGGLEIGSVNGGAGDDSIIGGINSSSILGGNGDDLISISGSNDMFQYSAGDGNDTIVGFDSSDKIRILDGSAYTRSTIGNDVIVNLIDGSIKLVGASSKTVNIMGGTLHEGGNIMSNSTSYTVINGTSGADVINNSGLYVTIDAGAGDDSIRNRDIANGTSINAGSGNDTINNDTSHNVTIDAGAGNDSIYGYYSNSPVVIGGAGNDTITLAGSYSGGTINYADGDGDDVVYYTALNAPIINITDGSKYSTTKSGNDVIVKVGSGSIKLVGASSKTVNVVGGTYQEAGVTINNSTAKTLLSGTSGDDSIYTSAQYVTVDAGAGNDSIYNSDWYVTINTGTGADWIYNYYGSYVTLNAGTGDDSIDNYYSSYVTINAGSGNDTVNLSGFYEVIEYGSGDGNDIITNIKSNNIIKLLAVSLDNTFVNGNDLILQIGNGTITLADAACKQVKLQNVNDSITTLNSGGSLYVNNNKSNTLIAGSTQNDSIYNENGNKVTIEAGNGDDSITNYYGDTVMINSGDGNDSIYNRGRYATINAGDGNDQIYNANEYVTINAGDGDDSISNNIGSNYMTINGGKGNDLISLDSWSNLNVIEYGAGDGIDTIIGYKDTHTIRITDGSEYSTVRSDNDVIINFRDGSIKLTDAADKTINILGGTLYEGGTIMTNRTARTLVSGTAGADEIINSSAQYVTIDALGGNDVINNKGDVYSARASINGGTGNDSIKNTGGNSTLEGGAGNDTIENTGAYVNITGGTGDDVISIYGGSTAQYNTYHYANGDGNDTILNYKSTDTIKLADGSYYTTQQSGADVIVSIGSGSILLKNYSSTVNIVGGTYGTAPINNTLNDVVLTGTDNADSIVNLGGNRVTINGGGGSDTIGSWGANVNIHGGADHDSIYIYAETANNTINGGYGNDTIRDAGSSDRIFGESGADYIYLFANGSDATVDAGADNDSIYSAAQNSSIFAGIGDDYIHLYTQGTNNTVRGDWGNDTLQNYAPSFVYQFGSSDGSDVILGATSSSTIVITDGSKYTTQQSGADVIVSIGSGSILLKDYSSTVNIVGGTYSINNTLNGVVLTGTSSADYITNSGTDVTINSGEGDDIIDNSGSNVTINAGDGDDLILNDGSDRVTINAGAGNDYIYNYNGDLVTINAGAGDDRISLSSNSNYGVIEYASGDGFDTVFSYKSDDTIRITDGSKYTTQQSGADVIVSIGSGSIRLKDYSATVNIVGGTYSINNTLNGVVLTGTENDDRITNRGSNVTINGGDGADIIDNQGNNSTINGGAGNDTIYNQNADYASVNADAGNDYILIYNSSYATLNAGDGYDSIDNRGERAVLNGGAGNDSIDNSYAAVSSTINGGAGADYINNIASLVAINAGDGNDSIYNWGSNVSINADAGNDYINNRGGYNTTLNAGAGNDVITLGSSSSLNVIQYKSGDGYDTVFGYKSDDTIRITDGSKYTTQQSGSDVLVSIGSGSILLTDVADQIVNITGGTRVIENTVIGAALDGTEYDDYISNSARNVRINALAGNDTINNANRNVTISGGAGDDSLFNTGSSVSIDAGAGNDDIYLYHGYERVTLNAGAGNDSVVNQNTNTSIDLGDGDDYIQSFDAGATVLGGSGNDTLDIGVYVDDYMGTLVPDNNLIDGGDGDDYIEINQYIDLDPNKFVRVENITVNGGDGSDWIRIYNTSNALIRNGAGDDNINLDEETSARIEYTGGNDIINGFNEDDTLSIADGLSYATTHSGNDVVFEFERNDLTLANVYGKTLNIVGGSTPTAPADGFNTIKNDEDNVKVAGTEDADYITNTGENVTVQAGGGDDSIDGSDLYGELFMFSSADGNDTISNFGSDDSIRISAGSIQSLAAVDGNLIITVKGARYEGSITLLNTAAERVSVNGSLITYVGTGEDIINHKSDIAISGTDYDDYILTDGARVTVEGKRGNDIIDNDGAEEVFVFSAADGNDTITNFGADDSIKIKSGTVQSITPRGADHLIAVRNGNVEGTILLQNTADYNFTTLGGMIAVDFGIPTLTNDRDNYKFSGTTAAEYLINTGERVSIEGKGGDDTITGSDEYGEMFLFSSADGNNVITNFGKGDSLKMTAGKTLTYDTNGDDVVVTLKGANYTGTVRLLDAGDKQFTVKGSVFTMVDGAPTLRNDRDGYKFVGTSDAEYMINTGERVTLQPNDGDDTVVGSDEYGEMILLASNTGNNVITNFGDNDTIRITAGKFNSLTTVGDDVLITIKGNAYSAVETLLGAASKQFTVNGSYISVVNGAPTLTNDRNNVKFVGTSKAEWLINSGSGVTIDGKGGGDTIEASNNPDWFLVSSAYGSGNVILGFDADDSIRCTAGKIQSVETVGNDVLVSLKGSAYSGDYLLKDAAGMNFVHSGSYVTVDAGAPTLDNTEDGVKFVGTAKDEYLINYGENVTVEAKGGNDTIEGSELYGEMFNFSSADGNNIITNFGKNDSLRMTAGQSLTFATVGSDVVVTLKGKSYTGVETLIGAAGLNFVKNGSRLTVEADAEPLFNGTDNVKFTGTDGADYMINTAQGVTIQSGAGNDTVEGSDFYGELFNFSSADGNNVITNFGVNDTLKMTAGQSLTFSTVGSDVIVTLKGSKYTGTVKLENAAGLNFKKSGSNLIVDNGAKVIINSKDNVKVSGLTGADWIENSGENVTIEAKGGNDTIVGSDFYGELFNFSSADGNNLVIGFDANDTLKATAGSIQAVNKVDKDVVIDLKGAKYSGRVTLAGAASHDFVQDGNVLTVKHVNNVMNWRDRVKLVGTNGPDWLISTGEGVSLEGKGGDDTLTGSDEYGDVFMISSADGNDIITNFGYNDTLRATGGSINNWTTLGDDVIVTIKGATYMGVETLLGAAGLEFKKSGSNLTVSNINRIVNSKDRTTVTGKSGNDYIINSGEFVTIQPGAGNDTVEGSDEYGEMFLFASNTGDNVVLNFRSNDTLRCTAGSIASFETIGNDVFVSLKGSAYSGSVTLKDAAGLNFKQSGKYLTVDGGVNTISNASNDKKVVGTAGDDWIVNSGERVSIEGKGGSDTIEGSSFAETFLFSSADGNNVVTNFGVNDSLKMTAGKTLTFATVGADVVVTLKGTNYTGVETLQGAAGMNFKKSGSTLYVDVPSQIFNSTDNVKVDGTSGADYITNVGQGATIESKGGNDTIVGSDFYGETFNFSASDGDNIIVNFGADDTLRMTSGTSMTGARDGNDYVVTLKNNNSTATVTLTDVGANTFRIGSDGKTLQMRNAISIGSSSAMMPSIEDYWFLEETGTSEIDSIMNEPADNPLGDLLDKNLLPIAGSQQSALFTSNFVQRSNRHGK